MCERYCMPAAIPRVISVSSTMLSLPSFLCTYRYTLSSSLTRSNVYNVHSDTFIKAIVLTEIVIAVTFSNGPLYSNNVISTLAVDGWYSEEGPERAATRPVPFSLYQV